MIEKILLDYLSDALTLPVALEVKPGDCVVLEKTGGSERDFLKRATVAIQSYGGSLFKAAEINERVIAAMRDIVALNEVSSAKLNATYNFTDTATKRFRYQAVYDIVYFDD